MAVSTHYAAPLNCISVHTGQFALPSATLLSFGLWLVVSLLVVFTSAPASAKHHVGTDRDFRFSSIPLSELEKIGVQSGIAQDKQGFIWFAGSNGLARFDGYEVKIFRNNPQDPKSLNYNDIFLVHSDRRGRVWVGTSKGLNLYDEQAGGFIHYHDQAPAAQRRLPSNFVISLAEDPQGDLWLGTLKGELVKLDGNTAEVTNLPTIDSRIPQFNLKNKAIRSLHLGEGNILWVALNDLGLVKLNISSMSLSFPKDHNLLTRNDSINKIIQGPDKSIWLGTSSDGLIRYNPKTGASRQYKRESLKPDSLHHNSVWDMFFDNEGQFWIATDDSLDLYLEATDNFRHFKRLPGTNHYGKVRSIFQSSSGGLWFGLFPLGTAFIDRDKMAFRNFQADPKSRNSLSHTAVTAIAEDKKGNFWIGTEGGLNYFNPQTQTFTQYLHEDGNPSSLPSNSIISLLIDSTERLWVGTWKAGWAYFDEPSQTFISPPMSDGSKRHFNEEVWEIYEDKNQQLWLAGLYLYDRKNNVFHHYKDVYPHGDTLSSTRVKVMYEDRSGNFWVGTIAGLNLFDRQTGKIKVFNNNSKQGGLSDVFIQSILEDTEGRLWIGTTSGGLNRYFPESESFSSIRANQGLFADAINGMVDDGRGSIWIISTNGLIHYDKNRKHFELFDRNNGLEGDLFHRNAILTSSRGEIVFGGASGFNILNPENLETNPTPPPIVITKVDVLNKEVTPSSHPHIINRPVHLAEEIHLSHTDNVVSIHYAALNYRMSGQNRYAYKLKGFDQDWIEAEDLRKVTYTNLDPGSYAFHVKGSNNSGVWNDEGTVLKIHVEPAWWQTTGAYIIYVSLALVLATLIFYVLLKLKAAKNDRLLNDQLRQIDQMKDAFLANTSHELRTPLNGIIGLTESIISSPGRLSAEETLKKLEVVVNSSKRLSNIINDILDFSKLKSYNIELHKTSISLHQLVDSILLLSEPLTHDKPITLSNQVAKDFPYFAADEQRLNQILFNLLGNAIKFTERGSITIAAETTGTEVALSISDTGIGISADDAERIFQPFEQSFTGAKGKALGTGLGLAVTKKLVELHNGYITLESELGKGSKFTVFLPLEYESAGSLPTKSRADTKRSGFIDKPQKTLTLVPESQKSFAESEPAYRILVVDDEPVNRLVLQGYLGIRQHTVIECSNGREALNTLDTDKSFDLVLLDVMMPGLSGYEVCRKLRCEFSPLELPVIFLTAKSQTEDLAEGLEAGAVDFLSKPVIKEELLAKIDLHVKNSRAYKNLQMGRQTS